MFDMNELLENKFGDAEIEYDYDFSGVTQRHNEYGYVRLRNPNYAPYDDEREYLIRKPTLQERREIVINTIIECNGRSFKIRKLAYALGVSQRTMQLLLRQLEREGVIEIIPRYSETGKQKPNAYKYIGTPCKRYGTGLTLQALHNNKQNVGFRDWMWKDVEFRHDGTWYNTTYLLCGAKFEKRVARRRYLEQNNLPLIVQEDVKYLALRYCYWKGKRSKRGNSDVFCQDGTIKLDIFPLCRTETIEFYGYTLSVTFAGTKENPQAIVADTDTGKTLGVFSWFTKNVIESVKDLDDGLIEQYFILGDFTTK